MHEASLITNLLHQIMAIMRQQGTGRVVGVTVKLGALSHISPDHFREHFMHGARGTIAGGVRLALEIGHDLGDPYTQNIVLACLDVEIEE